MRKHLITGLVVLLPVALTIFVIYFLFDLFTAPLVSLVGPLVAKAQSYFSLSLPEGLTLFLSQLLSLIFLLIFILLLGFFTQLFLVKNLLHLTNHLLSKTPLLKTVYSITKDLFSALFSADGKRGFKNPVRIPYPSKPIYGIGFEAGEIPDECQQKVPQKLVPVFLPTAPHPISGFFFLVDEKEVQRLQMTNEEAIKILVSCGMILPNLPPFDVSS